MKALKYILTFIEQHHNTALLIGGLIFGIVALIGMTVVEVVKIIYK